jgi:membrane protein YqaA with SNARE-associated domain
MFSIQLPPVVTNSLPFLAAAALAMIAFVLGGVLAYRLEKSTNSRLADYAADALPEKNLPVPTGSFEHRVRIAFLKYNVRVDGNESLYLWLARGFAGVIVVLLMLISGLPILTSLIGFVAGYVLVNGLVSRAWNNVRTEMEAEIPGLLSGLKSAVSTAPNVPQGLEDTARTLRKDGPLRAWGINAASRMHAEGHPAIEALRLEAAIISTSLAICVELIGRMWTTGGEGYALAFESAATNLRDVLNARVMARARGAGAQGTVNLLMGLTFLMIVFLTRSPSMAATINTPLIQIVYAGIFLMIVYGYTMIGDMIDKAV